MGVCLSCFVLVLVLVLPPISPRTGTLFPYPPLFRSAPTEDSWQPRWQRTREPAHDHRLRRPAAVPDPRPARQRAGGAQPAASADAKASTDRHDPRTAHSAGRAAGIPVVRQEIGRAHV